jgi:hypothetical protein
MIVKGNKILWVKTNQPNAVGTDLFFGQITYNSDSSNGWTIPDANAVVETDGVPILPGYLALVVDDDIGSLNE